MRVFERFKPLRVGFEGPFGDYEYYTLESFRLA